jgi:hypothetical protein
MNRLIPVSAVAAVAACVLSAGSAQAAPVSSDVLGKAASTNHSSSVEQVYWRRHHHRYWRYRYYRHHRYHRWWW